MREVFVACAALRVTTNRLFARDRMRGTGWPHPIYHAPVSPAPDSPFFGQDYPGRSGAHAPKLLTALYRRCRLERHSGNGKSGEGTASSLDY